MYQKLLKNIQARINSGDRDNKKKGMSSNNMKSTDDESSMNNVKNSKSNKKTKNNHIHSNSNSNTSSSTTSAEDEKDEYSIEDLINAEVSLREVQNADDRKALFMKKLKLCCILFDFTKRPDDLDQNTQLAREMKRTYLLELVEYISQSKHWFSEDCVPVILDMIGTNLFRSLPPPIYEDFDPDEDEPNFDPSWYYLHISISFLCFVMLRIFAYPKAPFAMCLRIFSSICYDCRCESNSSIH